MENKLFLGFGILALLSGIFLTIQSNYVIGVSGSAVGALLIYLNWKALKDQD